MKRIVWTAILSSLFALSRAGADPAAAAGSAGPSEARLARFDDAATASETRLLSGGATLTIGAGTKIRQLPATQLALGGTGKTPTHVYQVSEGRVDVTITSGHPGRVAVLLIGPGGHSSVTDQGKSVLVARPGSVGFGAIDRPMLTGHGSSWRKLSVGRTRTIDLKTGKTSNAALPRAPSLSVLDPLQISLDGGFLARVKLSPVSEAQSYRVGLFKDDHGTLTPIALLETKSPMVRLAGRGPGNYLVVARSFDRLGIGSAASHPESMRVMSVSLPHGARVTERGIRLPPRRRLGLVGVRGLEMTYGESQYFVAAPESVGMSHASATKVRFRDRVSHAEAALTLLPEIVRAKLEVGPKTAHWPGDDIMLRIRLFGADDRPLESTDGVEARVTVNLSPVEVKWQRQGNTLSARLAQPRSISGPWVVRVDVSHETIGHLGRDFLEIAKAE